MVENKLDKKKEFIAKIAIDVFFAKGYKESSLKDIATKGKLSKAGIYYYFKSKSDLLFYILLHQTDSGLQQLEGCLEMTVRERLAPLQSFEKLIRLYIEELLNKHKISLVILRERHQITGTNKKILTQKERAIFRLLRNKLNQVPNRKKKININLMSFQIMSMIHWMGYWFDPKGTLSKKEAIDQTISVIFTGILDSKNRERV
jgi:AcrR family transcriptional regulator